jgi:hypothetical protein
MYCFVQCIDRMKEKVSGRNEGVYLILKKTKSHKNISYTFHVFLIYIPNYHVIPSGNFTF